MTKRFALALLASPLITALGGEAEAEACCTGDSEFSWNDATAQVDMNLLLRTYPGFPDNGRPSDRYLVRYGMPGSPGEQLEMDGSGVGFISREPQGATPWWNQPPYTLTPGAIYWFVWEGCLSSPALYDCEDGQDWSGWRPPVSLMIPDYGTHWGSGAWAAGWEVADGTYRDLAVCAAQFTNQYGVQSQQVGKYFDGACAFPYGGGEQWTTDAIALSSVDSNVAWTWNNQDGFMTNAIVGGWENGQPLYVCRAWHQDPNNPNNFGYHPGKVIGSSCDISYGGAEIFVGGYWQVLRRD